MTETKPYPTGTATLVSAAEVLEQTILRLSELGLFVSPAAGTVAGQVIYAIHVALNSSDTLLTNAAHFAGQQIANGNPDEFSESVASAARLRKTTDLQFGSALPIEEIECAVREARVNLLLRGLAIYFGEYALDGVPDAGVVHIALSEHCAFSSHVALLAGLQWRRQEPLGFERLARALADQAHGQ